MIKMSTISAHSVLRYALLVVLVNLITAGLYGQTNLKHLNIDVVPQVTVQLVEVPAGSISTELPIAGASGKEVGPSASVPSSVAQIPSFFISTSEITFAQLVPLLDPSRVASIRDRIDKTSGKDSQNQYLRDAIGSTDYPAFALSFDDALEYCAALTKKAEAEGLEDKFSIESRRFRIPSHLEWQYACRAISDPKKAAEYPHFNLWIDLDALPKETRAKVAEEWQKLGKPAADLTGSQRQIIELLDARWSQKDALVRLSKY